jgi:hypothetical protein
MTRFTCVLEGLPGAGKTAICESIVRDPRFANCRLLPEFLPNAGGDPEDTSYYVSIERQKSALMQNAAASIVCDRYWQSSAIYCAATAMGKRLEDLTAVRRMLHREPTYGAYVLVHLRISTETSRRRARPPSVPNSWCAPAFCERAAALYDLAFKNAETLDSDLLGKIQIETAELTPDQSAQRVCGFLSDLGFADKH